MKKGQKMSLEQRSKIALSHIGVRPSDETRHKMSIVKLGKPSWNKNKASPWAGANGFKKGMTAWNKGKEMPTVSEKMKGNTNGSGNKGKVVSKETCLKLSLIRKGKPLSYKLPPMTKEHKEKLSFSHLGKIVTDEEREKNRQGQYKRYLKINPDYVVATRNKRIAINGGFHSDQQWKELKKQCNFTCLSCGKQEPEIKLTKDHILPLLKKGSNNIENIQPLCKLCNSKKHTQNIKY